MSNLNCSICGTSISNGEFKVINDGRFFGNVCFDCFMLATSGKKEDFEECMRRIARKLTINVPNAHTSHHSPQSGKEGEAGTGLKVVPSHTSPSVQSHQTKKDMEVILKER